MLAFIDKLRQDKPGRQDGDDTYGHVHVEHPAPAPVIGDPATQSRPNDRGETEYGHDQALPFPALSGRKDIADDSHGDWHHRACSQALNATVDDQLGHILACACQGRAG